MYVANIMTIQQVFELTIKNNFNTPSRRGRAAFATKKKFNQIYRQTAKHCNFVQSLQQYIKT